MQFRLWRAAAFVSSPIHLYRYRQVLGVCQDFSARWRTRGAVPGTRFTPDFCISVGYLKKLWTDFDEILCVDRRLLKNACMYLHEMLRVDRCRTWMNWSIFEPDPDYSPDCFLQYHFSCAMRNFTPGKSDVYVGLLATAARSAFNMVLFTEPVSRRNTFVRGKCTPPSALIVCYFNGSENK